jgi:hypothetical protein
VRNRIHSVRQNGANKLRSTGLAEVIRRDLGLSGVIEAETAPLVDSPVASFQSPLPPRLAGCGASNTATESQVRENEGVSIDWLTVHQTHEKAPLLGETLLLFCDLDTGEVRSQSVKGLQHRGSHDSSLQVRCDGRRVEVSGNPSKWGRFDNLYGHASVASAIEVFNGVLAQLGLPAFAEEERAYVSPFQFQRSDSVLPAGPVITRVDLCRNWMAGSAGAARSVVAALASVVRVGKCAWLSPDGNTAAWGVGSRYAYTKYYLKAPELRKHPGADPEYSAKLADWCDSVGIVRQEVSLKSMLLKRHGLDRPGKWTMDTMRELMDEYSPHRDAGAGRCDFLEVQSHLVATGLPVSRARAAQTALYAYLAGHRFVVGENISKSAFYRLRADLRVCGVDIAAPLNVSTLPVRIRELELSPAVAPAWYRWAG